VVGEELRNGTNNWYQKMNSDRYSFFISQRTSYEVDVIGFLDEITKFTAPQCMNFYNSYYSPNNAFIVVVGNVKTAEVFALAENTLEGLQKQLNIKKKESIPTLDTSKNSNE